MKPLSRRAFLSASVAATLGTLASRGRSQEATVTVSVRVREGVLNGLQAGEIRQFRGVPFAQPPVGPLRFRPPQPPKPYPGPRDATRFAAQSMQHDHDAPQSEDCLYLNVWAPAAPGPHPVFVWIHGGGFTGGRSFDPLSDGARFADAGIVCITVAYRLGVLGFLDVAPLLGPAYAGSANNALLDLIAALSWVQANAASFGGDPGRVTIGGESAGAKLTDLLLGTPAAEPLFAQAISESGGADRIWTVAKAADTALGFATIWTRSTSQPATAIATAAASDLIDTQEAFTRDWPVHFPLRPELSESLVPSWPLDRIRAGAVRHKRLLIGTNRDESALFIGPHPRKPVTAANLGNLPLTTYDTISAKYAGLYPRLDSEHREIRALTAEEYWIPSMRVADAHTRSGGETFVYRFDFPDRGRYAGLTPHAFELRFIWQHFGSQAPSPVEQALADSMHQAWIAFIQGRAPAAPALPPWPAYTLAKRETMILGAHSHVEPAPAGAEFHLWDGLLEHGPDTSSA